MGRPPHLTATALDGFEISGFVSLLPVSIPVLPACLLVGPVSVLTMGTWSTVLCLPISSPLPCSMHVRLGCTTTYASMSQALSCARTSHKCRHVCW